MLHADGITNSMKLSLRKYTTDEGAVIGAWVFVEAGQQEGVRR